MKRCCIYGGGNIAHSLAAGISLSEPVGVITRRPGEWQNKLTIEQGGRQFESVHEISAAADASLAREAQIIIIALPQFAVEEAVDRLLPHLRAGQLVMFAPAPALAQKYAQKLEAKGCLVAGFQRVPFISRIERYGQRVRCSEPRAVHKIAASKGVVRAELTKTVSAWFGGEVSFLSSLATFAFSNSNPLLHPARLVELLRGGDNGAYETCPYFYAEWTDTSSQLYIMADREMYEVFKICAPESASADYESVLEHYGVANASELTAKIRSIDSFKSILAPWKVNSHGRWEPDFTSRYFTEDIPYGTRAIQQYARLARLDTPTIDFLIENCQQPRPEAQAVKLADEKESGCK